MILTLLKTDHMKAVYLTPSVTVLSLAPSRETMQVFMSSQTLDKSVGAENLGDPVVISGDFDSLFD